jgi:hypothetical protein
MCLSIMMLLVTFYSNCTAISWKHKSSFWSHFLDTTFFWSETILFFLWQCSTKNVYAVEVQDSDSLINCILVTATDIWDQHRQLVWVRHSIEHWYEAHMWFRDNRHHSFSGTVLTFRTVFHIPQWHMVGHTFVLLSRTFRLF